jgi:hypothetical protein
LLNESIFVHRHTIGEYLMHNHPGTKYRQESIVEHIQVPSFEPLFLEPQHGVGKGGYGRLALGAVCRLRP